MTLKASQNRNRKDHIIPVGYLRGFVHPQRTHLPKPLFVFDISAGQWLERSPKEIAFRKGFYDYTSKGVPEQTAERAFTSFETGFPRVRDFILANGFASWLQHKDFLLHFGQMLRTRSLLYRFQSISEFDSLQMFTLTELIVRESDPEQPGKYRETWKYEPFKPRDELERQRLARNKAITDMREELKKGPDWFADFDWTLQYTESPDDPIITSDQPVVVDGRADSLERAVVGRHADTLIFIPLCWQMCLIGSPRRFLESTGRFQPADLARLRSIQRKTANEFLAATTPQLAWIPQDTLGHNCPSL